MPQVGRTHSTALSLSARELDVLELTTAGLSIQEIARRLSVSPKTVRAHLTRLLDRLDVSSPVEASAAAIAALRVASVERHAEVGAILAEANMDLAPEDFLEDVREAVHSLRRPQPPADPASQLTPAEAETLGSGGFDLNRQPSQADPVGQTAAEFTALLANSLDVPGVSRLLGVTEGRVRQMLAHRDLYGIRTGAAWRIPALQFTDVGLVPGLSPVVRALPEDLHPVAIARWLTTPNPDLELGDQVVSPLAWLRSGADPQRVATVASDL